MCVVVCGEYVVTLCVMSVYAVSVVCVCGESVCARSDPSRSLLTRPG